MDPQGLVRGVEKVSRYAWEGFLFFGGGASVIAVTLLYSLEIVYWLGD